MARKRRLFNSVGQLLWYMHYGYIGKSRKWARRRSKKAIQVTNLIAHDPHIKRLREMAGATTAMDERYVKGEY